MKLAMGLAKLPALLLATAFCAALVSGAIGKHETRKLTKELRAADALIARMQSGVSNSSYGRKELYHRTAKLLQQLSKCEVELISKRSEQQGDTFYKHLSQIEEKSYQLKTMLMQLQQNSGATSYITAVSPEPLRYPYYNNAPPPPSSPASTNPFG